VEYKITNSSILSAKEAQLRKTKDAVVYRIYISYDFSPETSVV
jgi:hypothetical protein